MESSIRDTSVASDIDIARLAATVTPTIDEVRIWHVAHILLEDYWDTPLVKLLRFLTDPRPVDKASLLETDADDAPTTSPSMVDLTVHERQEASLA